jgi:nucleoside-diphosphate-sugar epimerase
MKALFIGGTGTISGAITRQLSQNPDWELFLLNRGNNNQNLPGNVKVLTGDVGDEEQVRRALDGMTFDVIADFIAFVPEQVERDIRLFAGKTKQYIFISSASAYQKPLSSPVITESTPLSNPYWKYSREKIECEELLMGEYRKNGFPVTIVRPSHTYGDRSIPVCLHGAQGSWQVLSRMLHGKPVIVPGDGATLWTVTHNSDFAKGFIGLMGNIHAIGEAVHITSDESLTWNQIYKVAADALGVPAKLVHISTDFLTACKPDLEGPLVGDKCNTVLFDNTKLKRLVPDFCATVRFDQGARKTVSYLLSHPEFQVEDTPFEKWCDAVINAHTRAISEVLAMGLEA